MSLIAVGAAVLFPCVLIVCLPTLAVAVLRADGRATARLALTAVVCALLTAAAGTYLIGAGSLGWSHVA